jgi:hypothetical protein
MGENFNSKTHLQNTLLIRFFELFRDKKRQKKTKNFMMFLNPKKMYSKVAKTGRKCCKNFTKAGRKF